MSTKEILRTLSDTELIALASEVNNPNISNEMILGQLMGKSNDLNNDPNLLHRFPEMLSYELSLRLRSSNEIRCKCD